MIRTVICALCALFCVIYAIFPKWFLQKKNPEGEVTPRDVLTARIFGVILAVICIVAAVVSYLRLP